MLQKALMIAYARAQRYAALRHVRVYARGARYAMLRAEKSVMFDAAHARGARARAYARASAMRYHALICAHVLRAGASMRRAIR